MSITLSKALDALDRAVRARLDPRPVQPVLRSACRITSLTSVDLPDPETPVTATKRPTGTSTSMFCRLCCARRAPAAPSLPARRARHRDLRARPDRNAPVIDSWLAATSAAGPAATTRPPCSPAPGPMSTSQSAAASCPRRARRRSPCCRCRAAARASRSAGVVALVQADRRLVEDVEHARPGSTRSASRAGSAAPRRPTGSPPRGRASGSRHPTSYEEREPLADLAHHPRRRSAARSRTARRPVEQGQRGATEPRVNWSMLRPPTVTASDSRLAAARPCRSGTGGGSCTPRSAPSAGRTRSRGSAASRFVTMPSKAIMYERLRPTGSCR